jgi:hypothetical protein
MVLKSVFAAVVGAALLASNPSMADGYKPDEFLSLDLSKAALSPKPLGPAAQFEPVRVEDNTNSRSNAVHTSAVPKAAPKIKTAHLRTDKTAHVRTEKTAHVRTEKRHAAARTKLVRRHTNPLDAQAFDTRIQVWPCKSGGICNWQR